MLIEQILVKFRWQQKCSERGLSVMLIRGPHQIEIIYQLKYTKIKLEQIIARVHDKIFMVACLLLLSKFQSENGFCYRLKIIISVDITGLFRRRNKISQNREMDGQLGVEIGKSELQCHPQLYLNKEARAHFYSETSFIF